MSPDEVINVRFHPPPEDLRGYFTTFYYTEISTGDGPPLRDALQPEWANLRISDRIAITAAVQGGAPLSGSTFIGTGPTSLPVDFSVTTARIWGVGLLPLGWARYIDQPAVNIANLCADGNSHPVFARFRPLAENLFAAVPDEAAELQRIIEWFRAFPADPPANTAQIVAIHDAIVDPQLVSVQQLAERIGTSQRTVERLCLRHFGFSPKLLLRRQRFMRSLAQFMLDPTLKWIEAIDSQYHDQAQFVRDFHEFMSMTPREYAAMPHPVLERFMHERMRVRGAPVQTMDRPDGSGGHRR